MNEKYLYKEELWLIVMLIVGALLRLYHLEYQSPWVDEIFTLKIASPNNTFGDIYRHLLSGDQHPPLYYFSIHALFETLGEGIFAARMFSVVFGVLGIASMYFLAKELVSKSFALIPTLLTTLNFFHIENSQEARMYSMLFLFACVSMLYLIKFVKNPNKKSAIYYGIAAGFLLNAHIFALFVLFAQGILLFIFLLKEDNLARLKMFYYACLAYALTFLLYIPTIFVLLNVAETKSFWIDAPKWDVFIDMSNVFFGKLDAFLVLLTLIAAFGIYYVLKNKTTYNIKKLNLGAILGIWIVVPFGVALIISLIKLPIIVPRYFIGLLPAMILLISLGIFAIKNLPIKGILLGSVALISLYVLILDRDYYRHVTKSQFRETAAYIDANTSGGTVVSSLSWYLNYFLGKVKFDYVDMDLNSFIEDQKVNHTSLKDFWYFDAHNRPYAPTESTTQYLDSLYYIVHQADYHDAHTKNFVLKSAYQPNLDFSGLDIKQNATGEPLKIHIEKLDLSPNKNLFLQGWSYMKETDSENSKVHVLLTRNQEIKKIFKPKMVRRSDVTKYFNSSVNLDYSGIEIKENIGYLAPGEYEFRIFIENEGKRGLDRTYQKITID